MPPKKLRLTEAQCQEWRNSFGIREGKVLNPKTGNYVNVDGDVAKQIREACDKNPVKTFKTEEDVHRWITNPSIHPITGKTLDAIGDKYLDIYNKGFKIMRKIYDNDMDIINMFPKGHCLFTNSDGEGGIDMLYYNFTLKNGIQRSPIIEDKRYNNPYLYEMLNSIQIDEKNINEKNDLEKTFMEGLLDISIRLQSKFPNAIYELLDVNDYKEVIDISLYKKLKAFIIFVNTCYGTDKDTKQKFILSDRLKTGTYYKNIKNILEDFEELASGSIVENKDNIVIKSIEDPVEQYFKKFSDKLKFLQDPKYHGLLNLTTYKIVDRVFDNDKKYKEFLDKVKIEEEKYNNAKSQYQIDYSNYEKLKEQSSRSRSPKSPVMPKRPIIHYGKNNEKVYTIGMSKPTHIQDSIYNSFCKLYDENKEFLDEFSETKDMPLSELLKHLSGSRSKSRSRSRSSSKKTREEIIDKYLYDDTKLDDKNRCSETIDYLSNEDFEDEYYPLAKLQLMVRLKINRRKQNDRDVSELVRTDCVYAPHIYNQFVSDLANKKILMTRYREKITDTHIDEIMKKIRLIDKNIPRPSYVKLINDKKLKIEVQEEMAEVLDDNGTYVERPFYVIYITRKFGNTKLLIWKICSLPADIDPSDISNIEETDAGGSSDIASSTMIYRIFKMFNEGRLLNNYVPPYFDRSTNRYIALNIHFNNIKTVNHWLYDSDGNDRTRQQVIRMFKHYASEINEFHIY